jgi:hypothetical protein
MSPISVWPEMALLGTSFSGTAIFRDRGRRHLLIYIDDFSNRVPGFFQDFSNMSFATLEA